MGYSRKSNSFEKMGFTHLHKGQLKLDKYHELVILLCSLFQNTLPKSVCFWPLEIWGWGATSVTT